MLPSFAYLKPGALQEAVHALQAEDTHLHAGGTDLLGCLHDGVFTAKKLVSLSDIEGLSGVRQTDSGTIAIGAMTRISELAGDEFLTRHYPGLTQAAAEVASPQLRNQGTLGGNLCQKPRCWYYRGDFPCLRKGGSRCFAVTGENEYHCIFGGANCFIVHPSDIAPVLVALDAEVETAAPDGGRRLPVADLHMPPARDPTRETVLEAGEIITAVQIPAPREAQFTSYRKVRTRRSWDFAVAGCALSLHMDGRTVRDCRIVLSGAAPVPWRSQPAEQQLRDQVLDETRIAQAARAAVADAQPMTGNAYKIPLFEGLLTEELNKALRAHSG